MGKIKICDKDEICYDLSSIGLPGINLVVEEDIIYFEGDGLYIGSITGCKKTGDHYEITGDEGSLILTEQQFKLIYSLLPEDH